MAHIPRSREGIPCPGDVTIASGLITLTFPLMVIVAILIKCDSRGAMLVRVRRFAAQGQPISALTRETASRGNTVTSAAVTRIDRFLECTRMVKLPQLSK